MYDGMYIYISYSTRTLPSITGIRNDRVQKSVIVAARILVGTRQQAPGYLPTFEKVLNYLLDKFVAYDITRTSTRRRYDYTRIIFCFSNPNEYQKQESTPAIGKERNRFKETTWEEYDAIHQKYMEISKRRFIAFSRSLIVVLVLRVCPIWLYLLVHTRTCKYDLSRVRLKKFFSIR